MGLGEYKNKLEKVESYSGQKKADAASDFFIDLTVDAIGSIVGGIKGFFEKRQQKKIEKEAARLSVKNSVWVLDCTKTEEREKEVIRYIYFVFGEDTVDGYNIYIYKGGMRAIKKRIKSSGYEPNVPKLTFSAVPFTQGVITGVINGSDKKLNFTVNNNTLTIPDWDNSVFIKTEIPKEEWEANYRKLVTEQKIKIRKRRIAFFSIVILLVFVIVVFFVNYRDIVFNFIK